MKDYILLMRDDRFWIVGPFDSFRAASQWGNNTQIEGTDDPRWQTIKLSDARLAQPLTVLAPDHPDAIELPG